jgi:hypothetical protein
VRLLLLCTCLALPTVVIAQSAIGGEHSLRLLTHQALVRSALGTLLPPERRVSQTGVAISLASPWRPLRAEGRILRSSLGSSDLHSMDAGFVVGWRAFAVAAAYGQRASYDPESGLAHARGAEFGRFGVRLSSSAATSLFSIHLRGDTYVPAQAADTAANALRGWDAEGGVTWRARRQPLTASVGYRLERFRIFRVEQEVSALTFSLGVAFGGR